jgi:hypothetical protein
MTRASSQGVQLNRHLVVTTTIAGPGPGSSGRTWAADSASSRYTLISRPVVRARHHSVSMARLMALVSFMGSPVLARSWRRTLAGRAAVSMVMPRKSARNCPSRYWPCRYWAANALVLSGSGPVMTNKVTAGLPKDRVKNLLARRPWWRWACDHVRWPNPMGADVRAVAGGPLAGGGWPGGSWSGAGPADPWPGVAWGGGLTGHSPAWVTLNLPSSGMRISQGPWVSTCCAAVNRAPAACWSQKWRSAPRRGIMMADSPSVACPALRALHHTAYDTDAGVLSFAGGGETAKRPTPCRAPGATLLRVSAAGLAVSRNVPHGAQAGSPAR